MRPGIPPFEERLELLRRLLGDPEAEIATNVAALLQHRPELHGRGFEEQRAILAEESDARVRELRRALAP